MALYNVVQSCVVNGLHYVRPTDPGLPIDVDDDAAGPLVESGCLTRYGQQSEPDASTEGPSVEDFAYGGPEANPKPRTRGRRSPED